MRSLSLLVGLCWVVCVGGCRSESKRRAPAIGEAYAGPASLGLREEINLRSKVVASAAHGERLEVIERRRRFLKVRTAGGIEGWTDERQLLRREDMDDLRRLAAEVKSMPSQGAASTYDTLNVHTEPYRSSPSFLQVKEGVQVDVIAYRSSAQTGRAARPIVPLPTPAKKAVRKKARKESSAVPPPAMPPAPKPPEDWEKLSRTAAATGQSPPEDTRPVAMDDWTLIRMASGQSGWVLTRRLYMAIPDEVAQYAEGRRITSYFAIGEVRDKALDQTKKIWLWTTAESGRHDYDFDSFRVFTWSVRKHRYETAYIERNRAGFLPVLVQPEGVFSVCVERRDGKRYRRSLRLTGNSVRGAGETNCETAPVWKPREEAPAAAPVSPASPVESPTPGLPGRIAEWRKRWFGR